MNAVRVLILIASLLLPGQLLAQVGPAAATLAEQMDRTRRQLELRHRTGRPADFEALVKEEAERAFYTPRFDTAIQAGDTAALRQLLRDWPEVADPRTLGGAGGLGKVPLMIAAERGHLAMVDLLLRWRVSPDGVPPHSFPNNRPMFRNGGATGYELERSTPLHAAARAGHVTVVERLLAGGARIEARDGFGGHTALGGCVQRITGQSTYQAPAVQPGTEAYQRQVDVIQVLLRHGALVVASGLGGFNDPLALAASRGGDALLDLLLTNSLPVHSVQTNRFGPRETQLHAAVRMGRTNALAVLVARQPRPDFTRTNVAGLTALQLTAVSLADPGNTGCPQIFGFGPGASFNTAHTRQRACAELLLAAGAELDLFTAAGLNRADDVRRLIDRSAAAVASADPRGRTPLHWAMHARATNAMDVLLAARPPVNAADRGGMAALHLATGQGDAGLMARLLGLGADVRQADAAGTTPLHHAAGVASPEPLQLLLRTGALLDVRDKRGRRPLDVALAGNLATNVDLLIAAAPRDGELAQAMRVEAFFNAAGKANWLQASNWLARGVDVNVRDAHGRTAFRLAADGAQLEMLSALHRLGADVNLADTNGVTPLMSLVSRHRTALDARLIAPTGVKGWLREQTLPVWLRMPPVAQPVDALLWLLDHSSDLQRTDAQGRTALFHLPTMVGDTQVPEQVRQVAVLARYLVQRGLRANARDAEGKTALHYAFYDGDISRAYALLEAGADIEAADRAGRTCVHHAVAGVGIPREIARPNVPQQAATAKEKNIGPLLAFAIANGADVRQADARGRTPLHTLLVERPAEAVHFASLLLTNRHGPALLQRMDKSKSLPAHLAFAHLAGAASVESTRLAIRLAKPVVGSARADDQGRNLLHLAAALPHLWPSPDRAASVARPTDFPAAGLPTDLAKEWRELVEQLAANKSQVRQADSAGDTPLHIASRHQHGELVRLLLARGADAQARNRKGETPTLPPPPVMVSPAKAATLPPVAQTNFWAAITLGDLVSVEAHLRENPTLATASNRTTIPIRAAAVAGQYAVAERLRIAGATDLAAAAMLGWTNTVAAVLGHHPERATEVIEGAPLLHWAARRGQLAVAQIILGRLTLPLAPDRNGLSARYHARTNAHAALLALLEQRGDSFTLFDAIALRDAGLMARLLAQNPQLASQLNEAGETPLFAATVANDMALVKLLLAAKADPKQRSHEVPSSGVRNGVTNTFVFVGNLPLHWAAWTNAVEIGRILLDHGAEVEAATRVGASALQYAAAQDHREFAELLVSRGAQVNFQEIQPRNQFGHIDKPTVANGCTALHYAVKHGQVAMVRWLLERGADMDLLDVWGQSPRDSLTGYARGFGLAEPRTGPNVPVGSPIQMLPPVEEGASAAIRQLLRERRRQLTESL